MPQLKNTLKPVRIIFKNDAEKITKIFNHLNQTWSYKQKKKGNHEISLHH